MWVQNNTNFWLLCFGTNLDMRRRVMTPEKRFEAQLGVTGAMIEVVWHINALQKDVLAGKLDQAIREAEELVEEMKGLVGGLSEEEKTSYRSVWEDTVYSRTVVGDDQTDETMNKLGEATIINW